MRSKRPFVLRPDVTCRCTTRSVIDHAGSPTGLACLGCGGAVDPETLLATQARRHARLETASRSLDERRGW